MLVQSLRSVVHLAPASAGSAVWRGHLRGANQNPWRAIGVFWGVSGLRHHGIASHDIRKGTITTETENPPMRAAIRISPVPPPNRRTG